MSDAKHALEKQSRWQASRRSLSWPEKIRMAEKVRESVVSLRARNRRVDPVAAVGEIKQEKEIS